MEQRVAKPGLCDSYDLEDQLDWSLRGLHPSTTK